MLRAAISVGCIALLIILINSMAEHRAENDLVLRLCADQKKVISDLQGVFQVDTRRGAKAIKEVRSSMIAAKLLFILPQEGDEPSRVYINRVRDYLEERCG